MGGMSGRLGDGMVGVSCMGMCLGASGLFDYIELGLPSVDPDQHPAGGKGRPGSET